MCLKKYLRQLLSTKNFIIVGKYCHNKDIYKYLKYFFSKNKVTKDNYEIYKRRINKKQLINYIVLYFLYRLII